MINAKIFKVDNYLSIKNEMLKDIDELNGSELHSVSKTDWSIPSNVPRKYFDNLTTFIKTKYYPYFVNEFGASGISINNIWFQQYYHNSKHDWHCHPGNHFSNIYYLELPDGSLKTEFKNPLNINEIITFDVHEGDLLTFPAWYAHRSPINIINKRKTVVVFNSCIAGIIN
jgi:hypothetical protein